MSRGCPAMAYLHTTGGQTSSSTGPGQKSDDLINTYDLDQTNSLEDAQRNRRNFVRELVAFMYRCHNYVKRSKETQQTQDYKMSDAEKKDIVQEVLSTIKQREREEREQLSAMNPPNDNTRQPRAQSTPVAGYAGQSQIPGPDLSPIASPQTPRSFGQSSQIGQGVGLLSDSSPLAWNLSSILRPVSPSSPSSPSSPYSPYSTGSPIAQVSPNMVIGPQSTPQRPSRICGFGNYQCPYQPGPSQYPPLRGPSARAPAPRNPVPVSPPRSPVPVTPPRMPAQRAPPQKQQYGSYSGTYQRQPEPENVTAESSFYDEGGEYVYYDDINYDTSCCYADEEDVYNSDYYEEEEQDMDYAPYVSPSKNVVCACK